MISYKKFLPKILCHFEFSREDAAELSTEEAEELFILGFETEEWMLLMKENGEKGFAPTTYMCSESIFSDLSTCVMPEQYKVNISEVRRKTTRLLEHRRTIHMKYTPETICCSEDFLLIMPSHTSLSISSGTEIEIKSFFFVYDIIRNIVKKIHIPTFDFFENILYWGKFGEYDDFLASSGKSVYLIRVKTNRTFIVVEQKRLQIISQQPDGFKKNSKVLCTTGMNGFIYSPDCSQGEFLTHVRISTDETDRRITSTLNFSCKDRYLRELYLPEFYSKNSEIIFLVLSSSIQLASIPVTEEGPIKKVEGIGVNKVCEVEFSIIEVSKSIKNIHVDFKIVQERDLCIVSEKAWKKRTVMIHVIDLIEKKVVKTEKFNFGCERFKILGGKYLWFPTKEGPDILKEKMWEDCVEYMEDKVTFVFKSTVLNLDTFEIESESDLDIIYPYLCNVHHSHGMFTTMVPKPDGKYGVDLNIWKVGEGLEDLFVERLDYLRNFEVNEFTFSFLKIDFFQGELYCPKLLVVLN